MAKINRNAPCPCGSGKKYKRCCLPHDRQAATRDLSERQTRTPHPATSSFAAVETDLDQLSNSVLDLIKAGRLDEAEAACRELERQYPDAIDWIERTGAVCEARGKPDEALEYYRRCLDYIDENPEYFEEASKDFYRNAIKRLELSGKPPEPSNHQP